jgi:RNA polymerase I-specific transcription initiation factor RRN7
MLTLLPVAEQILELFPLQELPPRTPEVSGHERNIDRLKQVQRSLIIQNPKAIVENEELEDVKRPGELYRRYRTIDDLPDNAKAFYEIAGEFLTGLIK